MIILISIFLLCWLYATVRVIRSPKAGGYYPLHPFGVSESTCLKGLLAIGIVLGHLQIYCLKPQDYPIGNFFTAASQVGVFFFISGYGLTAAYQKKGQDYLHDFLKHRLTKIIAPLIIATCMYLVEIQILPQGGVKQSDTPLPFSWFCYVIIVYYAVFYLSLKLTGSISKTITILLLLTVLGYFVLGTWLHFGIWWYRSTIGFNLGMIVKQYENNIRQWFSRYTLLFLMLVPFGLFCVYASGHFGIDMEGYTIGFSLIILALIYACGIWHGKAITWLGKYSYEIYLCHPMAIALYPLWPMQGAAGDIAYVVFLFALTFLLAYLLKKTTILITSKI